MDSDNEDFNSEKYDEEEYTYDDDEVFVDEEEDILDSKDMKDVSKTPEQQASMKKDDQISTKFENKSSDNKSGDNSGTKGKAAVAKIRITEGKYVTTEYSPIIPMMYGLITEVSSLLGIDDDVAHILLQRCKWSKEKLLDQFFTSSEKLLLDGGLDLFHPDLIRKPTVSLGKSTTFGCRICCDTLEYDQAFALGCGHPFCKPCYTEYLKNQVLDGPPCIWAHCAEHKCKQAVTLNVFKLLLEPADFSKYEIYVMRNFIETSKTMKYCPAPGCDKVAVGSNVTTIKCKCNYLYCFRCGEESHDPISCAQLSEWSEKCVNESETANWILANTKKCPTCNTRIEKNQGCNHMLCKLCKHEFCWICMGTWSDHGQNTGGYYKCNRYDVKPDGNSSAAQKAKQELDRYLHYYQRYHGHDSSLKFASGQREAAEKRMVEHQEQEKSSWIDVQFFKQAAEQVIECRRVLKYTYVLGYFLEDGSADKHLFEHHQEMLEKHTEKLHEYTERHVDTNDRTQIINLTRVTDNFMTSLLSSVSNGIVDNSGAVGLASSDKK